MTSNEQGTGDQPPALAPGLEAPERREPKSPADPMDIESGDYNAARSYEATRGTMQEIYAREPRTEPWATERERDVLDYTRADVLQVDPDAELEIDCRTASCRVRIHSERTHLIDALGDYPFACMARYATADLGEGAPGARYADVYILFGTENQRTADFMANRDLTCPKYRERFFEFVKHPID